MDVARERASKKILCMDRLRGKQKKETHGLGREDVPGDTRSKLPTKSSIHLSLLKTRSSPTQWLSRVHVWQHMAPAPAGGWLIP